MAEINFHQPTPMMYLLPPCVSLWLSDEMLNLVQCSGLCVETEGQFSVTVALHPVHVQFMAAVCRTPRCGV